MTATGLAAAGGVGAVTSEQSPGQGSTLEAAGGDEVEESCAERGGAGQGAGERWDRAVQDGGGQR